MVLQLSMNMERELSSGKGHFVPKDHTQRSLGSSSSTIPPTHPPGKLPVMPKKNEEATIHNMSSGTDKSK